MPHTVLVNKSLLADLRSGDAELPTWLLGTHDAQGNVHCITGALAGTGVEDVPRLVGALPGLLPLGVSVAAIVCETRTGMEGATLTALQEQLHHPCTPIPLVVECSDGSVAAYQGEAPCELKAGSVEEVAASIQEHTLALRCAIAASLSVYKPTGKALSSAAIRDAMERLRESLLGTSACLAAEPAAAPVLLASAGCVEDCVPAASQSAEASVLQLLTSGSAPEAAAAPGRRDLWLRYAASRKGEWEELQVPLRLDALALVGRGVSGAAAQGAVLRAVRAQLQHVQWLLCEQLEGGRPLQPLRARHFSPRGCCHPVSQWHSPLPDRASDQSTELMQQRKATQALLGLPTDQPMLRAAQAWPRAGQPAPPRAPTHLQDVHVGVPPPRVTGGEVHMVSGSYAYHHYMQDGVDDNGWGCAYRSLQSIWSWLQLGGYTDDPPPSHRTIQETLVRIGDKPATFPGSKQWIGSLELSFLLDTLLEVTSKVVTVASGAELPDQARTLARHFREQGTPVMIGGGVLALTLLGVCWNEGSGEVEFLILDPHYKGADDLQRIQKGGWVAWKKAGDQAAAGGPMFVAGANYNLLLPQRPSMV